MFVGPIGKEEWCASAGCSLAFPMSVTDIVHGGWIAIVACGPFGFVMRNALARIDPVGEDTTLRLGTLEGLT